MLLRCRHYQKAVTFERRYQQVLSSSCLSSSTALLSASSSPSLTTPLHARRQLSSAFEAITAGNEIPPTTSNPTSIQNEASVWQSEASVEHPGDHDPLQWSSDSVFQEGLLLHKGLLRNSEHPASPQVVVRGSVRPNPLTSHTTTAHRFTHHATSPSRENPPRHPLTRKTSLPTCTGPHLQEWGPLSPLAKSRTPSGMYVSCEHA